MIITIQKPDEEIEIQALETEKEPEEAMETTGETAIPDETNEDISTAAVDFDLPSEPSTEDIQPEEISTDASESDLEDLTTAVDFDLFTRFLLYQIDPNPFNTLTTIRYHVPQTGSMRLVVYDMLGRKVRTLIQGLVTSGSYEIDWDGTDDDGNILHSGVYFCHISGEYGTPDSKKMLFVK